MLTQYLWIEWINGDYYVSGKEKSITLVSFKSIKALNSESSFGLILYSMLKYNYQYYGIIFIFSYTSEVLIVAKMWKGSILIHFSYINQSDLFPSYAYFENWLSLAFCSMLSQSLSDLKESLT